MGKCEGERAKEVSGRKEGNKETVITVQLLRLNHFLFGGDTYLAAQQDVPRYRKGRRREFQMLPLSLS